MRTLTNEFYWHGFNLQGEESSGYIEADTLLLAKGLLHKQGIELSSIHNTSSLAFNSTINAKQEGQFLRQLATLVKASLSLNQALAIMIKGQNSLAMRAVIDALRRDLTKGLGLSESLMKQTKHFNPVIIRLIQAGERAGKLESMLDQVASYTERLNQLRSKIKKALVYPLAIFLIAFIVSAGLLLFVVPEFDALFKSFNAELPWFTQLIIKISRNVQNLCMEGLLALVLLISGFIGLRKKSPRFKMILDYLLLKTPYAGAIIKKAITARFARTLAISHSASLPILESLDAVKELMANQWYSKGINAIQASLRMGEPLDKAIKQTGLFSILVVQMISIGEESGSLDNMLLNLANLYEENLNNQIDSLTNLIEPIIIILLGLLIGGLVVALYLPIFRLGSLG